MWNGFVNAVKKAVSSWTAPKQSTPSKPAAQTQSKPNAWSAPKQTYVAPKQTYSAPQQSKPASNPWSAPQQSYSAPKPQVQTQSFAKPSVSVASNLWSNPAPSYASPNLVKATGVSAPQNNYSAKLADLTNIGKGIAGLGMSILPGGNSSVANQYGMGAAKSVANIAGGTIGALGTLIGAKEGGISEKISGFFAPSVSASAPQSKSISTTKSPVTEMNGFTGMTDMGGGRWVSNDTIAKNKAEAADMGRLKEQQKEVTFSNEVAKLTELKNTGKITAQEYDNRIAALRNTSALPTSMFKPDGSYTNPNDSNYLLANNGISGMDTGKVNPSIDSATLNKSYDYQNKFYTDPTKTGQGSYDVYNNEASNVNSRIENTVNNIIREYENGQMSIDDANSRIAEAQRNELNASKNRQIGDANANIASTEADLQDYIGQENTQTQRYKDEAAQLKAQKENTYGELLKKSAKNASIAKGDIRNTFAALGTAESSTFIEKLTNLEQDIAGEQGAIDRQKLSEFASMDKDVLNKVSDSTTRILTSKRTTQENKDKILKAIQDLTGATDDKIFTLMADLATKTAAGKQQIAQQVSQLYSSLLTNQINQQNAADTAARQPQLIADQYKATQDVANMQSGTFNDGSGAVIKGYKRPQGAPQDMWDSIYQMMSSGINPASVMNSLKQQAGMNPSWAPWVGTMETILGAKLANVA